MTEGFVLHAEEPDLVDPVDYETQWQISTGERQVQVSVLE